MKKIYMAAVVSCLLSSPAQARGFDFKDFTSDLKYGAGIGLVDYGLANSGVLFYGIAEKELDVELGDFDTAAQLRVGTSTAGSTSVLGSSVEVKYSFLTSALFKASMPLQNDVAAYALLGLSLTNTSFTYSSALQPATNSFDMNFNFGVGADYDLNRDLKVGVEFIDYGVGSTFAANAYFDF